jgi:hypothetical protein
VFADLKPIFEETLSAWQLLVEGDGPARASRVALVATIAPHDLGKSLFFVLSWTARQDRATCVGIRSKFFPQVKVVFDVFRSLNLNPDFEMFKVSPWLETQTDPLRSLSSSCSWLISTNPTVACRELYQTRQRTISDENQLDI